MTTREALIRRLADTPTAANEAANELMAHPHWMTGTPPDELVQALLRVSMTYDAESPVFELGRLWERTSLSRVLMASLQDLKDPEAKTHAAWLLKNLASAAVWQTMAVLASSDAESLQTRRWLLEGLDRLAFVGVVGWTELRDLVHRLTHDPQPHIRDGLLGILMSLDSGEEKTALLTAMLADDDVAVLASCLSALNGARLTNSGLERVRQLSVHASPRVSLAAKALLDKHDHDGAA